MTRSAMTRMPRLWAACVSASKSSTVPIARIDFAKVGDVVAIVFEGRLIDRHEPKAIDAEFAEVIEPFGEAAEIAVAVRDPVSRGRRLRKRSRPCTSRVGFRSSRHFINAPDLAAIPETVELRPDHRGSISLPSRQVTAPRRSDPSGSAANASSSVGSPPMDLTTRWAGRCGWQSRERLPPFHAHAGGYRKPSAGGYDERVVGAASMVCVAARTASR